MSDDPGSEYKRIVTVDPALDGHGFKPAAAQQYLDSLKGRLQPVPGVQSVSLATISPLGRRVSIHRISQPVPLAVYINEVDASYFSAMAIPILRGRNFAAGETRAVIVGGRLAQKLWPEEDPLGKDYPHGDPRPVVIGVVRSARTSALAFRDGDAVEAYRPVQPGSLATAVVTGVAALIPARRALRVEPMNALIAAA